MTAIDGKEHRAVNRMARAVLAALVAGAEIMRLDGGRPDAEIVATRS